MKKKDVFTVKEAVEKIKGEAKTNVILLTHMQNISIEDKLYLMYFWGTRKSVATQIVFDETLHFKKE